MSELTDWLTKILDEDSDPSEAPHRLDCSLAIGGDYAGLKPCDCGMAAQWLADLSAKRSIIRQHGGLTDGAHECPDGYMDGANTEPACGWLVDCNTLRLLAAPHSNRPGWRQDWSAEGHPE